MKRILNGINSLLVEFGIDLRKTIHSIKGLPYYFRNLKLLRNQMKSSVKEFPFGRLYPCLSDRFDHSGSGKGHYFHQDLLVARRIHYNQPDKHVDVGSRVDGFVAHVASFRLIEVLDIRPLPGEIPNVTFTQADLMEVLNSDLVQSCDSLSCLHSIEHFGLGRYGDPINYDGYLLGMKSLYQILKTGGKLYFSVPIGPQRIEFDAHRVFSLSYLFELFDGKYRIDHFSFVDDRGDLYESVSPTEIDKQNSFGCILGCGIFEMTKL